jgi:hypothetical protein
LLQKVFNQVFADEAGRSGDKDMHLWLHFLDVSTYPSIGRGFTLTRHQSYQ